MTKHRKSDVLRMEEVDSSNGGSMCATFCSSANSLSQLYSHITSRQKLSFHAGERHALEKLYTWILTRQEGGSRVTPAEILAYLQNEIECGADETPMSSRPANQEPQNMVQLSDSSAPFSWNPFLPGVTEQEGRTGHLEQQAKNSVFSSALSSPVRKSLQQCHFTQGNCHSNNVMLSGLGSRNALVALPFQQDKDTNSLSNSDSSMDMHSDSPGHDNLY